MKKTIIRYYNSVISLFFYNKIATTLTSYCYQMIMVSF
ncbi:hypothetical protein EVA_12151 [gut metagenome]|uniref:Uncharacterized protein n=1 Tax=gut metagenome TaxID=749906 RepID=J9FYU1_9ZZZZ